nr:skin secretory protein xP2-like [Loxodonta africana]
MPSSQFRFGRIRKAKVPRLPFSRLIGYFLFPFPTPGRACSCHPCPSLHYLIFPTILLPLPSLLRPSAVQDPRERIALHGPHRWGPEEGGGHGEAGPRGDSDRRECGPAAGAPVPRGGAQGCISGGGRVGATGAGKRPRGTPRPGSPPQVPASGRWAGSAPFLSPADGTAAAPAPALPGCPTVAPETALPRRPWSSVAVRRLSPSRPPSPSGLPEAVLCFLQNSQCGSLPMMDGGKTQSNHRVGPAPPAAAQEDSKLQNAPPPQVIECGQSPEDRCRRAVLQQTEKLCGNHGATSGEPEVQRSVCKESEFDTKELNRDTGGRATPGLPKHFCPRRPAPSEGKGEGAANDGRRRVPTPEKRRSCGVADRPAAPRPCPAPDAAAPPPSDPLASAPTPAAGRGRPAPRQTRCRSPPQTPGATDVKADVKT